MSTGLFNISIITAHPSAHGRLPTPTLFSDFVTEQIRQQHPDTDFLTPPQFPARGAQAPLEIIFELSKRVEVTLSRSTMHSVSKVLTSMFSSVAWLPIRCKAWVRASCQAYAAGYGTSLVICFSTLQSLNNIHAPSAVDACACHHAGIQNELCRVRPKKQTVYARSQTSCW